MKRSESATKTAAQRRTNMSIEQMRDILCKQYHSAPKWVAKVSKMSDNQVIAIYMRMLNAGRIK